MRYLLFQCYAPLVSWGEIAIGGERMSSRQPSKSAVIGLLAAALGIRRDQDEQINALTGSLGFAVKMITGGTVCKDFHTVQTPKSERKVVYHTRRDEMTASKEKIGTILSRREYRCDALSVIAVWLKNDSYSLETFENAIKNPMFQLYFGRKSCPPAIPLNPHVFEAETIRDAFQLYKMKIPVPVADEKPDWLKSVFDTYQNRVLMSGESCTYFWEECDHSGFQESHRSIRNDIPLSRKRWQFSFREEYSTVEQSEEVADVSQ